MVIVFPKAISHLCWGVFGHPSERVPILAAWRLKAAFAYCSQADTVILKMRVLLE